MSPRRTREERINESGGTTMYRRDDNGKLVKIDGEFDRHTGRPLDGHPEVRNLPMSREYQPTNFAEFIAPGQTGAHRLQEQAQAQREDFARKKKAAAEAAAKARQSAAPANPSRAGVQAGDGFSDDKPNHSLAEYELPNYYKKEAIMLLKNPHTAGSGAGAASRSNPDSVPGDKGADGVGGPRGEDGSAGPAGNDQGTDAAKAAEERRRFLNSDAMQGELDRAAGLLPGASKGIMPAPGRTREVPSPYGTGSVRTARPQEGELPSRDIVRGADGKLTAVEGAKGEAVGVGRMSHAQMREDLQKRYPSIFDQKNKTPENEAYVAAAKQTNEADAYQNVDKIMGQVRAQQAADQKERNQRTAEANQAESVRNFWDPTPTLPELQEKTGTDLKVGDSLTVRSQQVDSAVPHMPAPTQVLDEMTGQPLPVPKIDMSPGVDPVPKPLGVGNVQFNNTPAGQSTGANAPVTVGNSRGAVKINPAGLDLSTPSPQASKVTVVPTNPGAGLNLNSGGVSILGNAGNSALTFDSFKHNGLGGSPIVGAGGPSATGISTGTAAPGMTSGPLLSPGGGTISLPAGTSSEPAPKNKKVAPVPGADKPKPLAAAAMPDWYNKEQVA